MSPNVEKPTITHSIHTEKGIRIIYPENISFSADDLADIDHAVALISQAISQTPQAGIVFMNEDKNQPGVIFNVILGFVKPPKKTAVFKKQETETEPCHTETTN